MILKSLLEAYPADKSFDVMYSFADGDDIASGTLRIKSVNDKEHAKRVFMNDIKKKNLKDVKIKRVTQVNEDEELDNGNIILEATDTKGAAQYLQNAFDKAGLTINVRGAGDTLTCSGSLNRAKFKFLIKLVNGKLNADFSGIDVDAMINKPVLKIGRDFRGGVQKFSVDTDNTIAELRTVKTFMQRLTRVLEKITVAAQKNKA